MSALIKNSSRVKLACLTAILLVTYICVAIPLTVIPVFVIHRVGLNAGWAGMAVGIAFLSTVFSRGYAGTYSDRKGADHAFRTGMALYACGGVISLAAVMLTSSPVAAMVILITGRLVLGIGESLAGVGVITWAVSEAGAAHAGRVIALLGAGIYAALAMGGPVGVMLYQKSGMASTMLVCILLPCAGYLASLRITSPQRTATGKRGSFLGVLRQIWAYGLIITLQGIGFAAIGAFFALNFMNRGWLHAGWGLTAFGAGFILIRVFFAGYIERFGGIQVAFVSLAVEALGQLTIWLAPAPDTALLGALLTGCGCSLIFPAMGSEIINLVSSDKRGSAVGGFSLFQDIAYGLTGPVAGLLSVKAGYSSPFAIGAAAAVTGCVLAVILSASRRKRKLLQVQ